MYHDSIFQESPIQAYQHHRVANANRFYRDTTRDNRLKRTPYDVPMSQSQNAMDVCSQQNRSKKSSRTEGGVISRVANSIKDTIVGLAKDFIYGTQQQSDSEEEEKEEKVKTQPHMQIDQLGMFCKLILVSRDQFQWQKRVGNSDYSPRTDSIQ